MLRVILIVFLLSSCAVGLPPDAPPTQKVIRGAEMILYTPLCLLYGICPDLNED